MVGGTVTRVVVRLIVSGLAFAILVVAAAYYLVSPRGPMTAAALQEPLHEFMLAGQANDVTAASRLLSVGAIRAAGRDRVVATFRDRALFDDYATLTLTDIDLREEGLERRASVEARVTYATAPTGALRAEMVLEDDRWRIGGVALTRE
jgi:hypothetical protein